MYSGEDINSPIKEIGRVLKKVRFDRNLTLDNVSDMTGVSKTMLGQIERGVSIPTISVLWKIAKGMKLSLSTLFNEKVQEYKVVNIEEDLQPVFDEGNNMILYNVFPFNPANGFEYLYIILLPGTVHKSDSHREFIEEYIVVTKGTLTLMVDTQTFILEAPSKIKFQSNVSHSYANYGQDKVVFQNIIKY
ncbi:MAG: XRE family transcriptional regulator [Megasphaera sp.]|jgi:transcriptional regulator with XRE-family HTH domain|uniref:helix-turn-helix domain-containing protein n=1 Tax=Megasphaera sueciensis TaxID=349094 RepID=UPI002ACB11F0|nr:XRE family transcriptional regulator [Megasphaera sp.]MCI1823998.1 XRE family transcriptional regulator [Megasphaera sp.]